MRLSEAIRLGSMLGPQAHGALHRTRRKYIFFGPVVHEHCALGAAFEASGAKEVRRTYDHAGESHDGFRGASKQKHRAGEAYIVVQHQWSALMWTDVLCPDCHGIDQPLYRMIPHLNDDHKWTREQIADWVQTIEATPRTPDVDGREPGVNEVGAYGSVTCSTRT